MRWRQTRRCLTWLTRSNARGRRMASTSKGSCWFLMMFFKLLLTPHSSRRQRTLTWDSSRREGRVFFCLCVRMGLWVIYGVFYTARGQRGVSERWAESGMERTPHSAGTAKAEELFSLFKIPSYNPRLLLFSPFPVSSHTLPCSTVSTDLRVNSHFSSLSLRMKSNFSQVHSC